ncbi:hypothetical protein ACEXQE_15990 [Herbiconiux sp. P17]|uniref:hypothetical protein n=1 Tax=Herbiconiux wuyangfengii TaxID=3342794 RepID=UPI0035BAFB40
MSSRLSPTGNGATDSSAPSGDREIARPGDRVIAPSGDRVIAPSGEPAITPGSANELRELRLEVAALRSQVARAHAEVEEYRKRLVASRNQCERYSVQLKALRASTSWSVTRPLRMRRRKSLNNGWT